MSSIYHVSFLYLVICVICILPFTPLLSWNLFCLYPINFSAYISPIIADYQFVKITSSTHNKVKWIISDGKKYVIIPSSLSNHIFTKLNVAFDIFLKCFYTENWIDRYKLQI